MSNTKECPICEGMGYHEDDDIPCPRCNGKTGNNDCPTCAGEGIYFEDCPNCDGVGTVPGL